jgi:hypothetical protein
MTDKFLFEPCIFYGILHAASCHIDVTSGKPTALTLWLETAVLRLIQERLQDNHAATEDVTRDTIILLALFTVRQYARISFFRCLQLNNAWQPFRMNIHSSAAHVRALLAILEASEYPLYAELESVPRGIADL